jgi:hypothetical protein
MQVSQRIAKAHREMSLCLLCLLSALVQLHFGQFEGLSNDIASEVSDTRNSSLRNIFPKKLSFVITTMPFGNKSLNQFLFGDQAKEILETDLMDIEDLHQ